MRFREWQDRERQRPGSDADIIETLQLAFRWGYPLMAFATNNKNTYGSTMNAFYNMKSAADSKSQRDRSFNADTLYSAGALDLSKEPLVFTLPPVGRPLRRLPRPGRLGATLGHLTVPPRPYSGPRPTNPESHSDWTNITGPPQTVSTELACPHRRQSVFRCRRLRALQKEARPVESNDVRS